MIGVDHPSGALLGKLYANNFVSGGALMVRAELTHLFNPIPPRVRCQDWWMAARVASVAEILWVPGLVYRYRQHGSNMNLGQADRSANVRDDLEFRRLVLHRPEADMLPLADVFASVGPLVWATPEQRALVEVTEADRARSAALEAEAVAHAAAGRS
jgi:hypothetical protein